MTEYNHINTVKSNQLNRNINEVLGRNLSFKMNIRYTTDRKISSVIIKENRFWKELKVISKICIPKKMCQ